MKWHANPAIDAAIQKLDEVLMSELAGGRCQVAAWRLMLLCGSDVQTVGAGCDCPSCRVAMTEATLSFSDCHGCPTRINLAQEAAG